MSKNMPLISVIIPVYNGEKYLAEAIGSVLAQEHRPLEVIVVDDGSNDGSAAIARGFAEVRYARQPNSGVSAALNRGVDMAGGDYLAFLDADDLWIGNKLSLQLAAFGAQPEIEAVFGLLEEFNSPGLEVRTTARGIIQGYHKGSMLIRQEAFHRSGRFDERRRAGDFIDWYARAREAGLRSLMLSQVIYRRRIHHDNMGLRERHQRIEYARIVKAALDRRRAGVAEPAPSETSASSVSVIIPVFNGEAFLAEAVASVRAQDLRPLEIIVVDDGSSDGTSEVAASLADGIKYIRQPNSGPPAARNTGLRAARGDLIAFLDADDLWIDMKLALQVSRLLADPTIDVLVGRLQLVRATLDGQGKTGLAPLTPPFSALSLGAALIRRRAIDRVGLLDESLRFDDDVDWFLRAKEAGLRLVMHPDLVLHYRRHGGNITRDKAIDEKHFVLALKKSLERRRKTGADGIKNLGGWLEETT